MIKKTYSTGCNYNGPQILEFVTREATYLTDFGLYDLTVWMRDESRMLAYELVFLHPVETADGYTVHQKYLSSTGKRLLTQAEEAEIC